MINNRGNKVFTKIRNWLRIFRIAVTPSELAWRTAAKSLWGLSGLFLVYLITQWMIPNSSLEQLLGIVVLIASLLIFGLLILLLFRLLVLLHIRFRAALLVSLPLLLPLMLMAGARGGVITAFATILTVSLLAGSIAVLWSRGFHPRQQIATLFSLLTGLSLLTASFYILFWEGDAVNPALKDFKLADHTLDLPNPGLPGEFNVLSLHYGSGKDRHRSEYADDVDLVTDPVDGSILIGNWKNTIGWARTHFWGFDPKSLPLQGSVWYPDGSGPYPLVLIVHGNHRMEDWSDPGYEYLGRLMASRGYIAVSVDENFLNSSIADFVNPIEPQIKEENDARGWLLLEHLRLWQRWNRQPNHLFTGKVDIGRIVLIGHSRGGEAVAIAAHFNQLDYYPDDATLRFDFHFNIKGVIAIAPVDGQYKPRGKGTTLKDTNYFAIHGSMDGDVQSFMGSSQYSRIGLSGDGSYRFKSSLYVVDANHGQFNTAWGRYDLPIGWILNTAPIMPAEEQRRIAEVYFGAFLEVVMHDKSEYMPMFQNAQNAADWLPNTFYLSNFQDSNHRWLSNFEEDGNPASTTLKGGRIEGFNLSKWRETWVQLKYNGLDTHALLLGWDEEFNAQSARIQFTIPVEFTNLNRFESLVFSVSTAGESTLPEDWEPEKDKTDEEEKEDPVPKPVDWTMVIKDSSGNESRLPLNRYGALYPQIKEDTRRAPFFYSAETSEPLFRYYAIPISDFTVGNPAFDSHHTVEFRFEFDRSPKGVLLLDDVGFVLK